MKALVTGGRGFIGSHLVLLLKEKGHDVIALDTPHFGQKKESAFTSVDIRDKDALAPYLEGVDWVFHLAAIAEVIASKEKPILYYETNTTGTLNLLECARKAKVKRFIYTASASCYDVSAPVPLSETAPIRLEHPYALTKYLGEELVMHWDKLYQLPALSLRLFNVYGPGQVKTNAYGGIFSIFLPQKLHDKPLTIVGDGTQTRDYIYVKDVARAFLLAAESSISGEIFNVGSGKETSINDIVKQIDHRAIHLPDRPWEPKRSVADIGKIKKMLGFNAKTSLEEGISHLLETIEDFRKGTVWEEEAIHKVTKSWY